METEPKKIDGTTQTAYTYNEVRISYRQQQKKKEPQLMKSQYSYDANGNQTDVKNTKTGQTESYTYDAENRLSKEKWSPTKRRKNSCDPAEPL